MIIIEYENMTEQFADLGKDLIRIDEDGELRAKRVALPINTDLWEEVEELLYDVIE